MINIIRFDLLEMFLNGLAEHVKSHPEITTQLVHFHRNKLYALRSQQSFSQYFTFPLWIMGIDMDCNYRLQDLCDLSTSVGRKDYLLFSL